MHFQFGEEAKILVEVVLSWVLLDEACADEACLGGAESRHGASGLLWWERVSPDFFKRLAILAEVFGILAAC